MFYYGNLHYNVTSSTVFDRRPPFTQEQNHPSQAKPRIPHTRMLSSNNLRFSDSPDVPFRSAGANAARAVPAPRCRRRTSRRALHPSRLSPSARWKGRCVLLSRLWRGVVPVGKGMVDLKRYCSKFILKTCDFYPHSERNATALTAKFHQNCKYRRRYNFVRRVESWDTHWKFYGPCSLMYCHYCGYSPNLKA